MVFSIHLGTKITGFSITPQPITLKILFIVLLSSSQKLPIMLNIIPITTSVMPQFIYNFIIFNDCISIVRLMSALILYTLCSILCLWENLCLILHQFGMIIISQMKIVIYKSNDQHVNKSTDDDFYLTLIICCNFHTWAKLFLLSWHYVWCFQQPIMLKIMLA